jgi:hypothetical protein
MKIPSSQRPPLAATVSRPPTPSPEADPPGPCAQPVGARLPPHTARNRPGQRRWNFLIEQAATQAPGPRPRFVSELGRILVFSTIDHPLLEWFEKKCAYALAQMPGTKKIQAKCEIFCHTTHLARLLAPACRASLGGSLESLASGELFPKIYQYFLTQALVQKLHLDQPHTINVARLVAERYVQCELKLPIPTKSPITFDQPVAPSDALACRYMETFGANLALLPQIYAELKNAPNPLYKNPRQLETLIRRLTYLSEMVNDIALYVQIHHSQQDPALPATTDGLPLAGSKYRTFERLLVNPDKSWNTSEAQKLTSWMGRRPNPNEKVSHKSATSIHSLVRAYASSLSHYRQLLQVQGKLTAPTTDFLLSIPLPDRAPQSAGCTSGELTEVCASKDPSPQPSPTDASGVEEQPSPSVKKRLAAPVTAALQRPPKRSCTQERSPAPGAHQSLNAQEWDQWIDNLNPGP